jgi:hypothetical protein
MIDESEILYEVGDFFVIAATFGSCRFKPNWRATYEFSPSPI